MVGPESPPRPDRPHVIHKKTFGTFQGVFTPTALTILGVIMYLREPWVVGNAGILGALLIVFIAVSITALTSLSMSSITTNIRIEAGGAFSIISQSLGLEMGGSIGIPLYFSQACAVAMYVFGFREGWHWIFPGHSPFVVDLVTFLLICAISLVSTDFAFKIQYLIMAVIFLSIVSIAFGLIRVDWSSVSLVWIGDFRGSAEGGPGGVSFWIVFAVFFPAVTGIMAGANMSGELTNPRKSIPAGTLAALAVTSVVYIGMVFVAAILATQEELLSNYTIFVDKAFWGPIVVAGLLGATFSSALTSFVGAPRILMALGSYKLLPASRFISRSNRKGEPTNAMVITAVIVILSLLLRDLNAIAPLITMFFMITYAMINLVVMIEQSLALPSFRPTLKVPLFVPLLGFLGCLFVMFIINATISLVSFGIVISFYWLLVKRDLRFARGDSRSGLFTSLAAWATKKSSELSPERTPRSWQPEILVPVEAPRDIRGTYRLLYTITRPKGSLKILGMKTGDEVERLKAYLPDITKTFNKAGISTSYTLVSGEQYGPSVTIGMQSLRAAFFKPNTVFLKVGEAKARDLDYQMIIAEAKANNWSVILYVPFAEVGLGLERSVNVWLDAFPAGWKENLDAGMNDLSILLGIIIGKNWNAKLNFVYLYETAAPEQASVEDLGNLKELARLPSQSTLEFVRNDENKFRRMNPADINILNFFAGEGSDIDALRETSKRLRTSCIFCLESTGVNALA